MTITNSALGYAGLFGYTLNGVVIQNVHLTDVSINISGAAQNVYAGALVAFIKVDKMCIRDSPLGGPPSGDPGPPAGEDRRPPPGPEGGQRRCALTEGSLP